jgi:hypothetical protein
MIAFDSVLVVDWSATAARAPKRPSKDAIWLGLVRGGVPRDAVYCRTRMEAEARIVQIMEEEHAAGRRLLATFDFPFGYPAGFARQVTGDDDPLILWDWLAARITDSDTGANNRFEVAEAINALWPTPGPLWGKTHENRWPGIPYRKIGIPYDPIAEKRTCDIASKAASSCFQLCFPPTVGSQILMGLPMLSRLRRQQDARVWPFQQWQDAPIVLAETWPGLIEPAVQVAMEAAIKTGGAPIRDAVQVDLLARAHRAMREALASAWGERADALPIATPEELLVMASLVELEAVVAEERSQVAGVFVRRLERGMRLQTDPTVVYGITGDFDGRIRRVHLRTDHPWNTYTRHGLPPTPIALPGNASIMAAANPADGDALYFVARGDGTHQFSATLAEHNRAVARYILGRE